MHTSSFPFPFELRVSAQALAALRGAVERVSALNRSIGVLAAANHPNQPPRYQSGALLLHELCRRVQPRGCITDLTPEDVGVFGESFLQGADAQLPPERRP